MQYLPQFEEFWGLIQDSLEMPSETKEVLLQCWVKLHWPVESSKSVTKSPGKKTGKINGYNIFVRERLAVLKEDATIKSSERMTLVAKQWNELDKDQKQEWLNKSEEKPVVPEVSDVKEKAPRKPSSYNLFMKYKMPELQAQGIPGKERMSQIAAMWKAMPESDKKNWSPPSPASPASVSE